MQNRHHRRSIRLSDYDYTQDGVYAVTICTHERACLFGEVIGEAMVLNTLGQIAEACWTAIPTHFPQIELDAFVIMPNHMHGMVVINQKPVISLKPNIGENDGVGARHASPLQKARGTAKGSLGAIVGSYKSAVSKRINDARATPGAPLWQRNYYEQVVRNDTMFHALCEYIWANPANWTLDQENPLVQP